MVMLGWAVVANIALFALSATAAESTSADTPEMWLEGMNDAFREQTYDGVFSFFDGSDLASLRVVHMIVDGEQRERLVHLNGVPREFVRMGEEVACILMPGDKLLELEDSMPAGPFARAFTRRFDKISEYYALSTFGEGRIANRVAVRLAISPRDGNRYGYRLWLDKATKLLLRSELIDAEGQRLEIFQFNQLRLGDEVQQSALEPEGRSGTLVSHLTLAKQSAVSEPLDKDKWNVGWLPAGFAMAASDARRTPSDLKSVDMLMYSDGIAGFSVFIESMPERGGATMVSRNGATVAVSHHYQEPKIGHHLVTVVGEVPTATAKKIASSIAYVR